MAQEMTHKFVRPLAVAGIVSVLVAASTAAYVVTKPTEWHETTLGGEEIYFLCPGPDDGTEEYAQFYRNVHNQTGCKGWGATAQYSTNPLGQLRRVVWRLDLPDYAGDHVSFVFGQWCGRPCNNTLSYDENHFRTGIDPVYARLLTPLNSYSSAISGEVEVASLDVVFDWQNRNYESGDPDLRSKPVTIRTVIEVYKPLSSDLSLGTVIGWMVIISALAVASVTITLAVVFARQRLRNGDVAAGGFWASSKEGPEPPK